VYLEDEIAYEHVPTELVYSEVDSFDLNVGQLDLFSLNPELLPPAFLEENLDSLVLVLASFTALSFNCIKLESVHD